MRGENRTDVQPVDHFLQDPGARLLRDVRYGLGQPAVFFGAGPKPAHPVHLFRRVGEVDVEGKGTDKVGGLLDWQGAKEFADLGDDVVRAPRAGSISTATRRFLGLLGQQAYLLHQLQQVVRRVVGTWVNRKLRRKPMIIPVVLEA